MASSFSFNMLNLDIVDCDKKKRYNTHQIPHLKVLNDNAGFTWDSSFVMEISLQWKPVDVKKKKKKIEKKKGEKCFSSLVTM